MNKLTVAAALMAGVACIPGNSPVRVTDVHPMASKDCSEDKAIAIGGGSLDVSGSGRYLLWFDVENEMPVASLKGSGGEELMTANQNDFVGTEVDLSYTSKDPVIVFETERIPATLILPPTAARPALINLIGPKAAAKLRDNVTDPAADPKTTLTVKMEFKGHTESGTSLSINPVYFPITVYTSAKNCTDGVALDSCAPGQDGFTVNCCTVGAGQPGCP